MNAQDEFCHVIEALFGDMLLQALVAALPVPIALPCNGVVTFLTPVQFHLQVVKEWEKTERNHTTASVLVT